MNKTGIKKIGLVETSATAYPDDRAIDPGTIGLSTPPLGSDIPGFVGFNSIDQRQASIAEELIIDENGSIYIQHLKFTVRTEADRAMSRNYEGRPIVMHVWTVDGNHYQLGTTSHPAYLVPSKTNSMDTVETTLTVEYETLTPIM